MWNLILMLRAIGFAEKHRAHRFSLPIAAKHGCRTTERRAVGISWQSGVTWNFDRRTPSHQDRLRAMAAPLHEEILPHGTPTHAHADPARAQ